jgi:cellulose synthase/poly-beta-1,6-N-acetylglucosamine synthase-like glycosyltransferase
MSQLWFLELGAGLGWFAALRAVAEVVAWSLFAIALVFVALLAMHLIVLSVTFLRLRGRGLARETQLLALPQPVNAPHVLVQLPVCNEGVIVRRTLDAAARLDWPRDRLHIQLLDDSSDETTLIAAAKVAELKAQGFDVRHLRRPARENAKAGNLKHGLSQDASPYVAIFDADFVPPADFLRRTIPVLERDAGLGFVQSRWDFLNRDESLLTRVQAAMLDAHFAIEQGTRAWSGLFMPFNGTSGVWRRAAIEDAGGWEGETLTEDLDLSLRAAMRGWRSELLLGVVSPSELPAGIAAWRAQQFRWTKGFAETARRQLPAIWRSGFTPLQKLALTFQLVQGCCYPFSALAFFAPIAALAITVGPPMWLLAAGGVVALLSYGAITFSLGVGQWALGRGFDRDSLPTLAALVALNSGLVVSNSRAVFEAFLGRKTAFVTTPKSGSARPLRPVRPGRSHDGTPELVLAGVAALLAVWLQAWTSPMFGLFALSVAGLGIVGSATRAATLKA